ncbi:MAG: phosphodiester glycosidase family protein [Acidobacteriota bacterium]|nr:phosphodiester glycosidase family protein [Acidobacteriota bacterium]
MKFVRAFFFIAMAVLPVLAQEFKTVRNGIEYAQFARKIESSEKVIPQAATVNALKIDLKKARLDVVHALDAAIGVEKTNSIAARHNAFAAINAGFFRLDRSIFNGEANGILQIDRELLSESFGNRIALGIINGNDKTEINFGHLRASSIVGFGVDSEFAFSGVNRERKPDEIILFTPHFNRTTLTDSNGTEIILKDCSTGVSKIACSKFEVVEGKGSSSIPPAGFVISIGKNAFEKSSNILYFARKKSPVRGQLNEILRLVNLVEPLESAKQSFFKKAEDIVGGVPQLIKNGKIEITWEQEKSSKSFVETRHPRTAIAKLNDGRALLVTVDGRSDVSAGMNLQELAEMLLEMGATDAMNLDGGGSTTMFLDGKIVNKPSDKEGERPVSDAILVTLRK